MGRLREQAKKYREIGKEHVDDPDAPAVADEAADDGYRLYITNLPHDEFNPNEISTLYRARWVVELLFRELKSRYSLGEFEIEKAHIVKIQVVAALLTTSVSRVILREFVDYAEEQDEECVFPTERWAATFRV